MLNVGSIAPEFSLKKIGRERVLLVFFKISCPTCQLTLPFLERLKSKVAVVGVSQDDARSTKEFLEYFQITFPVLTDTAEGGYAVSKAYRLTNVPSMFLIEPDGTISWALNGFHRADLEALAAMLGAKLFADSDKIPAMKPG